jgi:hypothetical protein
VTRATELSSTIIGMSVDSSHGPGKQSTCGRSRPDTRERRLPRCGDRSETGCRSMHSPRQVALHGARACRTPIGCSGRKSTFDDLCHVGPTRSVRGIKRQSIAAVGRASLLGARAGADRIRTRWPARYAYASGAGPETGRLCRSETELRSAHSRGLSSHGPIAPSISVRAVQRSWLTASFLGSPTMSTSHTNVSTPTDAASA